MGSIREEFEKCVKNSHDAAFKFAFWKIELERSFFRNRLPRKIVELPSSYLISSFFFEFANFRKVAIQPE
jgi:hypothetical protein